MKHKLTKKLKFENKVLRAMIRKIESENTSTGCPMCEIYNAEIDINSFNSAIINKNK